MWIFDKLKDYIGLSEVGKTINENIDVLIGLGQKYYNQNDFEKSQFFFGKVLKSNSNNVDYLNLYGRFLKKLVLIVRAIRVHIKIWVIFI